MIKYSKIVNKLAIAAVAASPLVFEANANDLVDDSDVRSSVSRYTINYKEKENKAESLILEANKLFQEDDYLKSRDKYIEAKKIFVGLNSNFFKSKIDFCDEQIDQCYIQLAMDAVARAEKSASINDYEEAIRLCKEAAEFFPNSKDVMNKRIAYYTDLYRKAVTKSGATEEALVPNKANDDYEIQILMRRGREYVNAGLYSKAARSYQEVLLYNPYNSDALQNLKVVNNYIARYGNYRAEVARNRAVVSNELEWALPIRTTKEQNMQVVDTPIEKVAIDNLVLANKIKSITIGRMQFTDVTLRSAIDQIVELSTREDPEGVGINIFLREELYNQADPESEKDGDFDGTVSQEAGESDEFTDDTDGFGDVGDDQGDDVLDDLGLSSNENFSELEKLKVDIPLMENKTIEEILNSIMLQHKDLRYRIEKYAVVIEPKYLPDSDLETRIFPVDATGIGVNPTSETVKEYFTDNNVEFPSGAQVVYDSKISRVIATNTLKNLELIEQLCDDTINEQEPLIQIQLRIIEISQSDLDSLGFNYSVSDSNSTPAFSPITTALRTKGNTSTSATFTAGDFKIGVNINAINNLSSKDVLASPRVTTIPGEEVRIKLNSEIYFVEDYDEAELQTSTADNGFTRYTYKSPFPNFESEGEALGIDFSVTPTLDLERRLIKMPLSPEISSLVGWTVYEGTTDEGLAEEVRSPIIARRNLSTVVEVSDGETIVLGGIISDTVGTVKDKIPFIGDIPLLGRLFQSRTKTSDKQNLLIFVTPRLIRPDGSLYYPDSNTSNRGVVKFF